LDKDTAERFLRKSGGRKIMTNNLIENEHGFMSWKLDDDIFVCLNVYGDGDYWDTYINELAKQLGCKTILGGTTRKAGYKAFERKYNFKLVGYLFEKEVL
jgi:hypothetical protein